MMVLMNISVFPEFVSMGKIHEKEKYFNAK